MATKKAQAQRASAEEVLMQAPLGTRAIGVPVDGVVQQYVADDDGVVAVSRGSVSALLSHGFNLIDTQ